MRPEGGKGYRLVALLAVMALAFVGAATFGERGRDEVAVQRQQNRADEQQAQREPSAQDTTPPPPPPQPQPPIPAQTPVQPSEPIDPTNPKRGPGAVLDFDPAAAPVVPAGGSAEAYVTQYYNHLINREYEAASAMVPKENPSVSVADFLGLLAGYEPEGFFVIDITDIPGGQTVTAIQSGADNRSWTTTWEFIDTARGRVLKDVKYALPQGGACH